MNNLEYIQYSRKSSEAKEKQALSISDQNQECASYASREGLNIVRKLEESKSAYKPHNRIYFDEMIRLIKNGEASAILTWHLNRLCRNPEEGGILIQLLQDGILKEIRTTAGEIYTPDSDHFILQIHFGMNNQYSRNISRDVKRNLHLKAERGEYPKPAPLGYENYGERGRKNIKPYPAEAQLIKELYRLASLGIYSLNYLVDYIYQKGLRTKRKKKVSKSHLYHILTSPLYYGYFYHNSELFKGSYEPLIDKRLWDKVQYALANRSKPRTYVWNNPYNGLLKCPNCGCSITTSVKVKTYKRTDRKATYVYLHCTRRKGRCNQPPITLEEFEKQMIKQISKITINEEIWHLGIKLLREKYRNEGDKNLTQIHSLQSEYEHLQQKLNSLINMRANGELTKEEFTEQKELILKERLRIENLINDSKNNSDNWLELAEEFLNIAFEARDIMLKGEYEEKRKLITSVGENLFLRDKKVEFGFKKPFDLLLHPLTPKGMLRD